MPVRNCRLAEAQELVNSQEILPIVSFSTHSFVIVPHRSTDLVSQLFTDQRSLEVYFSEAKVQRTIGRLGTILAKIQRLTSIPFLKLSTVTKLHYELSS